MKVLVGTLNQEKALVEAFSVNTNHRMDLRLKLYRLLGVGVAGDHLQDVLHVLLAAEEDGAALVQLPGNQVQDRLPDNTMVLCQGV